LRISASSSHQHSRDVQKQIVADREANDMSLANMVYQGFGFWYGSLALVAFISAARIQKPNFRKLTADDKKQLAAGVLLSMHLTKRAGC
jgi:hypothetical protein